MFVDVWAVEFPLCFSLVVQDLFVGVEEGQASHQEASGYSGDSQGGLENQGDEMK